MTLLLHKIFRQEWINLLGSACHSNWMFLILCFVSGFRWGLPSSEWPNSKASLWCTWQIRNFNVSSLFIHVLPLLKIFIQISSVIFCGSWFFFYVLPLFTVKPLLILQQSLPCFLVVSFLRNI
jgi:hypothetical protein